MTRRLKHWGWGYEDEHPAPGELRAAAAFLSERLGFGSPEPMTPVPIEDVRLAPVRLRAPPALAELCTEDPHERARHAYGRSYRDVVRAFQGRFERAPDVVARPRDEADVSALLAWALGAGAAVIPFGGGTSVVGGVEPRVDPERYAGVVTIDLTGLDRVLEVDPVSLSARIQAGATGPVLEDQLREHGLTLRHYPQSFQFSTLGGWIATRAGGHFSTLDTHIDDLVESVRAITPAGPVGVAPAARLGRRGVPGPDADRLRGDARDHHRGLDAGARAPAAPQFGRRALPGVQRRRRGGPCPGPVGTAPGRVPARGPLRGRSDRRRGRLLRAARARFRVRSGCDRRLAGGRPGDLRRARRRRRGAGGSGEDSASSWRDSFLRAPYLRDTFVAMGVLSETFETAITWERLPAFHRAVLEATSDAVRDVCGAGSVTCRLTHVYPDGAAPYYTVLGPARRGEELAQWSVIKAAASEAILAHGGTITHHHAIGRDHRPWYDRQRPEPFALALRGAKAALDPNGALNPGVLLDP